VLERFAVEERTTLRVSDGRLRLLAEQLETTQAVAPTARLNWQRTLEEARNRLVSANLGLNQIRRRAVDAVRFIVMDHGFNSSDLGGNAIDGSVYFEFDVLGTAVPTTPDVAIAVIAGQVVVTFTGVLQSAPTVTGTFTDVAGYPSSPLVLSTASQTNMMFFRARKP